LDDLVRAGKVHYVGVSTFPVWQTMEALAVARDCKLSSAPVSEQPPYNLLDRRVEKELLPLAAKHGLATLPWSPLASGILTGKYNDGTTPEGSRLAAWNAQLGEGRFADAVAKAVELQKVASEAGVTLL